jgi:pyroglutamyl-peptidase
MQPILVTGFEPFGAHRTNPSEQVVRALAARPGLVGAVLPVSYRRGEARLGALLEATQPCALLLLGLAAGSVIRLERVASNLDQAEVCDEDGELRCGRAVSERGPPEHASTLPLEGFAAALARLSAARHARARAPGRRRGRLPGRDRRVRAVSALRFSR